VVTVSKGAGETHLTQALYYEVVENEMLVGFKRIMR